MLFRFVAPHLLLSKQVLQHGEFRMPKKYIFALASISILLASCASERAIDRKVDQELAQEKPVEVGAPLAQESHRLIMDAPQLNKSQKEKLLALHAKVAGEMTSIREEEGRLKMVFFKTIINPKSDEEEILNLKSRILKLDRKKTNRMLSALEEARDILGRQTSMNSEHLFGAFWTEGRIFQE